MLRCAPTRPAAGDRRAPLRSAWVLATGLSLLAGCGPTSFLITPVPAAADLQEHVVERESPLAYYKLALIDVEGVLTEGRSRSLLGAEREDPLSVFQEKLDRAARDPRVRGVLLRINSPGGSVTASDVMYSEVLRFRERTGKPVTAYLLNVGASGGYYLACAASSIHAHPTSITGSIGVIMIAPQVTGTMHKLGIETNVIKSGPMKDAGSPFREMRPEERAWFQSLIDRMYERFLEVVGRSRRQIDPAELRELADGRVYIASDAAARGLLDGVGSLRDAIAAARAAAGLADKKILVVEYARPPARRANIYSRYPADSGAQVNLINIELPETLRSGTPQFMYLWAPGW
jgi:protease-4